MSDKFPEISHNFRKFRTVFGNSEHSVLEIPSKFLGFRIQIHLFRMVFAQLRINFRKIKAQLSVNQIIERFRSAIPNTISETPKRTPKAADETLIINLLRCVFEIPNNYFRIPNKVRTKK